jgi:hypothetical protein
MRVLRAACRIGLLVAMVSGSLAIVVSSQAGAATTTLGQLGGSSSSCASGIDLAQTVVASGTSYTVPAGNWIVTSWASQAGLGSSGPLAGSLQLEIWRPTGTTNQFELVGISPVGTTNATGISTFSLVTPITVQGGDVLGLRSLTDGYGCANLTPGSTLNLVVNPTAPVPGEVRTLTPDPQGYNVNVTATLESITVLQVKKVVSGTSSSGFTEQVQCTAPTIASVGAQAATTVVNVSLPYNADGTPDAASAPAGWTVVDGTWQLQDSTLSGATCTVTETGTGGATSVSYACAWTPGTSDNVSGVGCPGASSAPSATPASVTFEGNGDVGVLTVTNTFPTPTPVVTPPVEIAPKFTG